MGLILNDLKNACELEHVCDYVNNRTTSSMNYISTENMLPNKGGISESTIIRLEPQLNIKSEIF